MAEPTLEVDLNQLMAVGKVTLPHLAWTYAKLNNRVADTANYDNAAFAACPATAGWAQDQLRGQWTALRDKLQDILGRSAHSFEAAADAITQIAASYEAANAEIGARVRAAWRDSIPRDFASDFGGPNLPSSPPRVIMSSD